MKNFINPNIHEDKIVESILVAFRFGGAYVCTTILYHFKKWWCHNNLDCQEIKKGSYGLNIMYFGFNGSLEQTTPNFHDANQFEW
jgi:hypothetical protein